MDQIEKVKENNYRLPSEVIPDPGANIVLGAGHDYATVTDRIAGIVYLPWKNSPRRWLVGAFFSESWAFFLFSELKSFIDLERLRSFAMSGDAVRSELR